MKQGTGHSSNSARKVEPKAKAINPGAVAGIGIHEVRTKSVPLYGGRGFEAPAPVACKSHKGGSQGKH